MLLKKRFKEHSHIPIEEIKRQQAIYKKDIVQPRIGGEINPEFVVYHGAKNLNISQHDVERMGKIDRNLSRKLEEKRKEQKGYF